MFSLVTACVKNTLGFEKINTTFVINNKFIIILCKQKGFHVINKTINKVDYNDHKEYLYSKNSNSNETTSEITEILQHN